MHVLAAEQKQLKNSFHISDKEEEKIFGKEEYANSWFTSGSKAKEPGNNRASISGTFPEILPFTSFSFGNIPLFPPSHITVQPKLEINIPGDQYEQEADAVADKIMRMPTGVYIQAKPFPANIIRRKCEVCGKEEETETDENSTGEQTLIQRKCAKCGQEEKNKIHRKESGGNAAAVSSSVVQALHSGGQPLDKTTRSYMEPRFGFDFSKIRIHNDAVAHQSAREINALAYTYKNEIVFGAGQYKPHTDPGKKLLAHELTHVLQQRDANMIQRAADIKFDLNENMSAGEDVDISEADTSKEQPTAVSAEQAMFIVEDDAEPAKGQMRKTDFLTELNEAVCKTVDRGLRGTEYSSDNCPYIKAAFAKHKNDTPLFIEQLIERYSPGTVSGAKSAHDLIRQMQARVLQAVRAWVKTKDMAGIPSEIRSGIYDSMGEAVRSGIEDKAQSSRPLFKAKEGGAHATRSAHEVLQGLGNGHSIEADTKGKMENAFGSGLSEVEIHNDSQSAALASEMNARAFAVGNHIVFGQGEYRPGTIAGDALMAHELAHVVQQRKTSLEDKSINENKESVYEEDADRSAVNFFAGILGKTKGIYSTAMSRLKSGISVQRCPELGEIDQAKLDVMKPLLEKNLVLNHGVDPAIKGNSFEYRFMLRDQAEFEDYEVQGSSSEKILKYPSGAKVEWEEDFSVDPLGETAATTDNSPILDEEGQYVFTIDVRILEPAEAVGFVRITKTFNVKTLRKRSDEAFGEIEDESYDSFRAGLTEQLALLEPDNTPVNSTDTYITSSGANPAQSSSSIVPLNLTYQLKNESPGREHHWYIRPIQWEGMPDKVGTYTKTEINGVSFYDLGTGASANWLTTHPNVYVVVCKRSESIGQGQKRDLEDLVYVQTILTEGGIKELGEFKKYSERVDSLSKNISGEKIQVKAVHVSKKTGQVIPLHLFAGKNAKGNGYVLLDLTQGLDPDDFKLVYHGKTTEELKNDFRDDNKYPEGEINIEFPENNIGLDKGGWYLETTGTTIWTALSGGMGVASFLLALGAIVAAPFTEGGSLIVGGLLLGSAVTGVAAGTFSIIDNLKNQQTSKTRMAVDIAGIVASMIGGAAAFRAAKAGGNAVLLANSTTKYLLMGNFGIAAAQAVLISVDGVAQIDKILNSNISEDQKVAAITRIVANLIITGAMLYLAHKDMKAISTKINSIFGETLGGSLKDEERFLLVLVDEATLGKLSGAKKEDLSRLAKAIREDPSFVQRAATHRDILLQGLNSAAGDSVQQIERSLAKIRFGKLGMSSADADNLSGVLKSAGLGYTELNLLNDSILGDLKKLDDELRAAFADWQNYKTRIAATAAPISSLEGALTPARAAKLRDAIAAANAKQKILSGIPKKLTPAGATPVGDQREIVGGHSAKILSDPNVRVTSKTVNADNTISVTYDKLLNPGSPTPVYSKVRKNTTLAPASWSDQDIMDATLAVASQPSPFPTRPTDNASVHVGTYKGIEWEVIKENGIITSSYPTGGTRRTSWP